MVEIVKGVINAYDGEKNFVMSNEEYDEARNKYLQCPYLVVKKYFTAETGKQQEMKMNPT